MGTNNTNSDRRKGSGAPCTTPGIRRVTLFCFITPDTKKYIDQIAKDAGGSMGSVIDSLVETIKQVEQEKL